MKVAIFSTQAFEKNILAQAGRAHELVFFEASLSSRTAPLARGFEAVCCFVNDLLDQATLRTLRECGVRLIALRSAGYNNVDLSEASRLGLHVVRVPSYSPHAVAEYAVGLLLALNRKIPKACGRVRDLNFSLEGLTGFDLYGKTVGVIGTGQIGSVFASIMKGFGCRVLAFDRTPNQDLQARDVVTYVPLSELIQNSHVISLHVPLLPETRHLIDQNALAKTRKGALLINTGRGALVDSVALTVALKSGQLGGAALDVYEEEDGVFYQDLSSKVLQDDVLARLLTFPNVLITSHQAFLTQEALENIAETTFRNISEFAAGHAPVNEIQTALQV